MTPTTKYFSPSHPIQWCSFKAHVKDIVWHHSVPQNETFISPSQGTCTVFAEIVFSSPVEVRRAYCLSDGAIKGEEIIVRYDSIYVDPWVALGAYTPTVDLVGKWVEISTEHEHDEISFMHPTLTVTQVFTDSDAITVPRRRSGNESFSMETFAHAIPDSCPACHGRFSFDYANFSPNIYCRDHDPYQDQKESDLSIPVKVHVDYSHTRSGIIEPEVIFDRPVFVYNHDKSALWKQGSISFYEHNEVMDLPLDGAEIILTSDQSVGKWPSIPRICHDLLSLPIERYNFLGIKEIVTAGERIEKPKGKCPVCSAELSHHGQCTRKEEYLIYDPGAGYYLGYPHYFL